MSNDYQAKSLQKMPRQNHLKADYMCCYSLMQNHIPPLTRAQCCKQVQFFISNGEYKLH